MQLDFAHQKKDSNKLLINKSEASLLLEQLTDLQQFGIHVDSLNPIPYCIDNGKYLSLLNTRSCSAGITSCAINANGEVRACQQTSIIEGNILKDSFNAIWRNIPIWKTKYLPSNCKVCDYSILCGSGCRLMPYSKSNVLNNPDSLFEGQIEKRKKFEDLNFVLYKNFIFEKGLKLRQEPHGGVVYKSANAFAIIDEFVFDLLPSLAKKYI